MNRRRAHTLSTDLCLVVVAAVFGTALYAPQWPVVAAQIAAALLLLLRRDRPYAMAVAISAISLYTPAWATVLAPYAVTAHGTGGLRRRAGAIALLLVTFMIGARAWVIDDPFTAPVAILFSTLLGLYARTRRGLLAELTDRAERAERERLLLAEQARADERIRLAGEMHDVVTHRINLMVLQAGALRVTAPDDPTREAAENLRVAGCQALDELRDLVGVLRSGGSPPPPDEGLDALLGPSRQVGHPVRLDETGDARRPAPAVRRTLYRLVQESLTNVRKHAPGAATVVSVDYGSQEVRVSVCNDPPASRPAAPETGGHGLAGLRHRVEVVGGSLSAGATPAGGFAVRATLPVQLPAGRS